MTKQNRTGYFAELADLNESELDAAQYIARGVTLIRPGFSVNADRAGRKRYYPAATLIAAANVFEGVKAFRNHPGRADEKNLPERDIRDQIGYYKNVTAAADGRIVGDLHVVGEARQWLWPMIEETKRSPRFVEISINALGQTRIGEAEGQEAVIVESIVKANSADVVTTGAAGGTFFGALLHSDPDAFTANLLEALSFEEWRASRPEYLDRLKTEWKTSRDNAALAEAKTALSDLQAQYEALGTEHRAILADLGTYRRAEIADRLMAESTLPNRLRAAVRAELLEEADEDAMRRVLERERQKYAAAPKAPVSVTGAGQRVSAPQLVKPPNPALLEALGVNADTMPRDGESVTDWQARVRQIRNNQ